MRVSGRDVSELGVSEYLWSGAASARPVSSDNAASRVDGILIIMGRQIKKVYSEVEP